MTAIITTPVVISGSQSLDASTATFTSGAAYAINMSAQIINATWDLGNTKFNTFSDKVLALTSAIQGIIDGSTFDISASAAGAMTINEPVVTIPASIDTSTILSTFETEATNLIAQLVAKVQYIFTTFFPNDSADYNAVEAWLLAAINNPTAALPAAVQAQLFTEDRDRITLEATRATDVVMVTFAARRFPLPSGAVASAAMQIQQKSQDSISEASRNIVMKTVENMKWAVEKTLSLRNMAMTSALDYAKTMAGAQNTAGSVTGIGYDAQTKLISAVSSYYNARTEAQKAIKSAQQFDARQYQEAAEKNQVSDLTLLEDKVKALMAECAALAQMATSLFNNVHAGGASSYSVSA